MPASVASAAISVALPLTLVTVVAVTVTDVALSIAVNVVAAALVLVTVTVYAWLPDNVAKSVATPSLMVAVIVPEPLFPSIVFAWFTVAVEVATIL